jgi:hypothetical protein
MKITTIRYYLHNYNMLIADIDALKKQIEDLKACDIPFPIPCPSDADGSQHNPATTSPTERAALELAETSIAYKHELMYKMTILYAIDSIIRYLPRQPAEDTDWQIIQQRYFIKDRAGQPQKWLCIAFDLHYNVDYIMRRERKIVRDMIGVFDLKWSNKNSY